MARCENWESILFEKVAEKHKFQWGKKDCGLWVADILLAFTGIDYAAPIRDKYMTAEGAARALKRYGGGSLETMCDMSFPAIPVAMAQRGDVVLHPIENGHALGLCVGSKFAALSLNDGTVYLPMDGAVKAWRVA